MIVRRQFLILGAVMTLKCCKWSIFFFIKHNSPLKIDFWQTFKQCNIISLVNKGPKTLNLDITPHVSSVKIKIDAYNTNSSSSYWDGTTLVALDGIPLILKTEAVAYFCDFVIVRWLWRVFLGDRDASHITILSWVGYWRVIHRTILFLRAEASGDFDAYLVSWYCSIVYY